MKKVKPYKLFNESLKDKMKGKSEEELKNLMGEKKYNNWKKLNSIRDSIEEPLYLMNTTTINNMLKIETDFNRFKIKIENNKWLLDYINHKNQSCILYYNTWNEVLKKCKEIAKNDINSVLLEKQKEIDLILSEMDDMKKDLLKLN